MENIENIEKNEKNEKTEKTEKTEKIPNNLELNIKNEPVLSFLRNKICVYCKEKANLICISPLCVQSDCNFFCITCLMRNDKCKEHHFSNHENEIFDFYNKDILNAIISKEVDLQKFVKNIEEQSNEFTKNVENNWLEIEFVKFLQKLKEMFFLLYNESKINFSDLETKKFENVFFTMKMELQKHIEKLERLNLNVKENEFYEVTREVFEQRKIMKNNFQNIFEYKIKIHENENNFLQELKNSFFKSFSTIGTDLKKYLNTSFLIEKGIQIDKPFQLKNVWKKMYFEDYIHKTTNNIIDNIKTNSKNEDLIFVGVFHKEDILLQKPALFAIDTVGSALKNTSEKTKANKSENIQDLYWYFSYSKSFGFSKMEKVLLNNADLENEMGDFRLSWHLDGNGGFRIGMMNPSRTVEFKKAIFVMKNYSF